jgi:hypothetical protein
MGDGHPCEHRKGIRRHARACPPGRRHGEGHEHHDAHVEENRDADEEADDPQGQAGVGRAADLGHRLSQSLHDRPNAARGWRDHDRRYAGSVETAVYIRIGSFEESSEMLRRRLECWSLPLLLPLVAGGAAGGDNQAEVVHWNETFAAQVRPLLEAKCLKCHAGEESEGDFDLAAVAAAEQPLEQGMAWDRVAARIRLNEMPPPGSPGLSDPEKGMLHHWLDTRPGRNLCEELASDETKSWYSGRVMSRRLTHGEYDRMVAALFTVDLFPARDLPPDGAGGEGFDTNGDTLFLSPIHLERYLAAADEVVETVVTEAPPAAGSPLRSGWDRWVGVGFGASPEAIRERLKAFASAAWRRAATEADHQAGSPG